MDMDLEEQYFAELVDEEELPPEFYSWLKTYQNLITERLLFL